MNKLKSFLRSPLFTSSSVYYSLALPKRLSSWFAGNAPRTELKSPLEHLANPSASINKFYTVPNDTIKGVISPFLTKNHLNELKLFDDFSILVRKPALDVMACIESTKLSKSVPRFVLYGQPGCGISVQLGYLAHYTTEKNGLIFAFPNAEDWLDRCDDFTSSNSYHQEQHKDEYEGEAIDFPHRSAEWLKSFLNLNASNLEKLQPRLTKEVEWTMKDIAPVGTPWVELIKFALARTKYSNDCIGILLREMRALSASEQAIPCYLIVDGVNFLWCRGTRMQDEVLKKKLAVDRLAIVHHLRRALRGDWPHGAIITSVNERASWPSDREHYTPGYLLTKRGFEAMDPFVPVLVPNYTNSELDAVMHFYAENKWFSNPAALEAEGRAEIVFLSDANPRELARVSSEW